MGWRWVEGVMAIFTGVVLTVGALVIPETYVSKPQTCIRSPWLLIVRVLPMQLLDANNEAGTSDPLPPRKSFD